MSALVPALCTAANVWAYAEWHSPFNLAAAIFCGLMTIVAAVIDS